MKSKLYNLSAVLILSLFSTAVFSQKITFSKDELDRMKMTYSFYIIQSVSLNYIAARFPELRNSAYTAGTDWEREYLPSIENIDRKLSDTLKATWEKEREQINYKYSGTDFSRVNKTTAKNFVNEVFQRALGKIQSPVIETLLIFRPGYLENPEKEYADGFVNTYSTKKMKRPIGVDIQYFYPKSWKPAAGDSKAAQIQTFTSQYGLGQLKLSFCVVKGAKETEPAKARQLLTEESLKKLLGKNDAFVAYIPDLKIDNVDAAAIQFFRTEESMGNKSMKFCEAYHTYYKNFHIWFEFSVGKDSNDIDDVLQRYNNESRLIRRVMNSVVILSQWEHERFK